MIDFKNSKTRENLMRAFAGESQARNRYTFAQSQCETAKLYVLARTFKLTAEQEKVHAEIFYNHLEQEAGESIHIDGGYPVDISANVVELLAMAHHNEYEEFMDVYPSFAQTARDEGFGSIAQDFDNISKIEKGHGDRFERYRKLMDEGRLFESEQAQTWICLNCGFIVEGTKAPEICPVCHKEQGYYMRLE